MSRALYTPVATRTASWRRRRAAKLSALPTSQLRWKTIPPRSRRSARRRTTSFSSLKRSEEHTSELQSLMRISYAVFCLKKKKNKLQNTKTQQTPDTDNHKQHNNRQVRP